MTSDVRSTSAALLAAAAAVLAPAGCGTDDIGKPAPGTTFVSIRDTFFQPDSVTVMLGRSVRWTNSGALWHTVVSDGQLWQSDTLRPTWWFEVRFDSGGTFTYHCTRHPAMAGTVIVE